MDGQNFIDDVEERSILRDFSHQGRQNLIVALAFSSFERLEILEADFSTESTGGRRSALVACFKITPAYSPPWTQRTITPEQQPDHLRPSLSNRHLRLIATGGAIGTGVFMGSGKPSSLAGPSIVLVYLTIGIMLFFVVRAMRELLLCNLSCKSFINFSADLLRPWAGFFCGWTYCWFCWIVGATADVVAISVYSQYWSPELAPWIAALLGVLILLSLNLVTVKMLGAGGSSVTRLGRGLFCIRSNRYSRTLHGLVEGGQDA